ncbi:UDP-galactose/UDP-glucose transporter 7 isoform X2 [Brassica rapa]|uniref:UDP-galactose/UDP-glucose transporter 7 isoform X2 n=1 Tax=Brassica campestris TaxID=3711 RepID=UPI0004F1A716|nr:UDP-galactose/UDP-glucose transporter 7 isoform X2 [Brassica rapa]
MEVQPEMEPTSSISLIAAVSYGIASMAMVFINKAVIMQYPHSMTVLTLQQLATSLLIHCGRRMGYTRARGIDLATAKKLLPVSIFYNANVAFALASLKGVNIPMYIAIKRLTPLAVLIAGYLFGKGKPTTQVALSVLLTAAGCVIAALGDFSFDLFGYGLALTSVFFQTMYLVLVEKSGAEDGLSSIEIMFYNSFLSLPFLSFLIIVTGEFPNSISLLLAKVRNFHHPKLRVFSQRLLFFKRFQTILFSSAVFIFAVLGDACSFTGYGHCPQLHHVSLHHCELCTDNNHRWCPQRRWFHYARFCTLGWC